jgi:hypothetical protein
MSAARIIHRRAKIKDVRKRWLEQYAIYPNDRIVGRCDRTAGDIRKSLKALDLETCSVSDIDAAIGTAGWGSLTCDECGEDHEHLIRLGEEPDYDARWVDLCRACLMRSAALAETVS